jgi:hypothetical protein
MKAYEIRVTALGDDNDMASYSHYVTNDDEEEGDDAQAIIDTIQRQFTLDDDLVLEVGGRVVVISEALEQQGFYYTIYNTQEEAIEGGDGLGGGLCTGSWGDAIIMANELLY